MRTLKESIEQAQEYSDAQNLMPHMVDHIEKQVKFWIEEAISEMLLDPDDTIVSTRRVKEVLREYVDCKHLQVSSTTGVCYRCGTPVKSVIEVMGITDPTKLCLSRHRLPSKEIPCAECVGQTETEIESRNGDVAFLDGIVYVYYDRPIGRNPWIPVNEGGRGPALTDPEMKEAQLLVRDGGIVHQTNQHVLACVDAWRLGFPCMHENEARHEAKKEESRGPSQSDAPTNI